MRRKGSSAGLRVIEASLRDRDGPGDGALASCEEEGRLGEGTCGAELARGRESWAAASLSARSRNLCSCRLARSLASLSVEGDDVAAVESIEGRILV